MVDVALRWGIALTLLGASWATGVPPFETAWRVAAIGSSLSLVVFMLDRRGMLSAGLRGWSAVAEAGLIAWVLGSAGWLGDLGFLALAPCVWAASRHGASAVACAPLVAGLLLVVESALGGWAFGSGPLVQAAAVLALGLACGSRQPVARDGETEPAPASMEPAAPAVIGVDPGRFMQLREAYRNLRDHAERSERQRKADRLQLRLLEASRSDHPIPDMAHEIREALGLEGASVYTLSESGRTLAVRASSGLAANPQRSFDVEPDTRLIAELGRSLRSNDSAPTATVALRDKGRLVGMVCLIDARAERLRRAEVLLEGAASFVARILSDLDVREREARRVVVAELLYEVATVGAGAETPTTLAARVVRELWPTLSLDHLGIWLLDEGSAFAAATEGAGTRVMEALRFESGEGLAGWLSQGAPEVSSIETYGDGALTRAEALKRRIGSMAVLPIQFDERPFGFLVATTHRPGGVDRSVQEALRVVTAELSQAMSRLTMASSGPAGLASPSEFQKAMAQNPQGCFVALEPLDLEPLIERFGQPSVDLALHRLALRLRSSLPSGALLCRRPQRDFVAFLRDVDIEFARRWANDAAAAAALVPVSTPDGRSRMPLGLRARASRLGQADEQEVLLQNAG